MAHALELEGFLTSGCQKKTGLITYVSENSVEFLGLDGNYQTLAQSEIETLYVFNVIENPFAVIHIDTAALARLKAIYLEDSREPQTLAFPVRFIENLLIFYSLEGKSRVHTYGDIHKLRPAPRSALGDVRPKSFKKTFFEFTDQSARCPASTQASDPGVKPTRVLADKISISEFLNSFQQGYESLDSFQERTYLYAKPFLYDRQTRLGIIFQGKREEPGINFPMYFQWSTGEPYRFQSFSAIGLKNQEFTPNTEPIFSIHSDVKSHAFHALFIGNVAGLPAGNSIFGNDFLRPTGDLTVAPSFNYLAMMGGDYGPYSVSAGFFYPDYDIKVRKEIREVLGTSTSYAVRAMYTVSHLRLRVIGALTDYHNGNPTKADVIIRNESDRTSEQTPASYTFHARFLRGGIDYEYSDRLKFGLDGIVVNGNYKETRLNFLNEVQSNDMQFNKLTTQGYVSQSFSDYVSITAYMNLIQNNYKSNFLNNGFNHEQRETRFFGTFEFIF